MMSSIVYGTSFDDDDVDDDDDDKDDKRLITMGHFDDLYFCSPTRL